MASLQQQKLTSGCHREGKPLLLSCVCVCMCVCSCTKPGSVVKCLAALLYIEPDRDIIPAAEGRLIRVFLFRELIALSRLLLLFVSSIFFK